MRSLRQRIGFVCVLALVELAGGGAYAQWSNAALFSDTDVECKTGGIAPASGGGFHALWLPGNGRVRYRRYFPGGTLSTPLTVGTGTAFNSRVAESLTGEIHIVYEDWSAGPNNVRWYKSSNGGASFASTLKLTDSNCAKHPHITAFGTSQSPEMIMSYYRSGSNCDESLWFRRYNGATWTADAPLNSSSHSEYDCFGMARSPLDGSVWRTFDPSGTTMAIRRFDGAWGPQTQIYSEAWAVRQHMAINAAGQIMLLWDNTSRIKSMLYTPGVGSSPVVDLGPGGYSGACDVCAIPGTNDFYMVVARDLGGNSNFHVYGRRWSAGAWQAEESVQNGQSNAFMVTPLVAADAAGNLYCVWEYWGSGKPVQWYAVRPGPADPRPKGYIAGTVRDGNGQPLSGAMVVVQDGGTAVTGMNGAFNIQAVAGTHAVAAHKLNYASQSVADALVVANGTTTVDFYLSAIPPDPPVNLVVLPGNRDNRLNWTAPASLNFSGVTVRVSIVSPPAGLADGTHLADLPGTPGAAMSYVHAGLANGRTYYYSLFGYYQDASRVYNPAPVSGSGTPAGPGDYDRDGDVDQSDFAEFQKCLSGSYVPQPDPACSRMLFDIDTDVDQDDLAAWQLCFSGPGVPSNPLCWN